MNPIAQVVKIHLRTKFNLLYLPYLILLFSFFINYTIKSNVNTSNEIVTGGLLSIHIYLFVIGIAMVKETFAFSVFMSVRRTDYVKGTILMFIGLNLLHALLLSVFAILETTTNYWGVNLHFFSLPYLHDGALWQQIFINLSLLLNTTTAGFVVAALYQRLGKMGTFIVFLIAFVISGIFSTLATVNHWWSSIFSWLTQYSAFELSLWLCLLSFIYMAISYVFLRRSTV